MTAFDYLCFAIVAGSIVVALVRGLVAEVLSLTSWVIAFWCAKEFSPALSGFLPGELSGEGFRLVASFVLLFFLTWLATALLRVVLTGLMDSAGLGGLNRVLGAAFGLARGFVLVTALVLVGGFSDLPKQPMWQNALLSRPLEQVALSLRPWLPAMLANNLHYS